MSQLPPPIPPAYTRPPLPPDLMPPTSLRPLYAGMAPHRGGLILGLGIGSLGVWLLSMIGVVLLPCCGASWLLSVGLAIAAWVMANADLAAMNAGNMDPYGRGNTQGGKTCAIVSVVLHVIGFVVTLVLVVLAIGIFGAAAAGAAGHRP